MNTPVLDLYPAWLFAILVATASSVVGLLSVWAGLGRGHWFLRLAAVGATLALGIVIPAYDLVLLFFTQAAVVILTLVVVRAARARRGRQTDDQGPPVGGRKVRFRLLDLLLAVAVAGGIFAVVANVPTEVWGDSPRLITLGASLGAVTLAAAWAALGKARTLIRLAIACLVTAAAGSVSMKLMAVQGVTAMTVQGVLVFQQSHQDDWWLASMIATAGIVAVQLVLARASRRGRNNSQHDRPSGRAKMGTRSQTLIRVAQLVLIGMIVLPPAYTWYRLVTPLPIPNTPLPDPNAYEELVELGNLLDEPPLAEEAPAEVLRPFVSRYGPVLDRAAQALRRESAVPVNYLSSEDFVERLQASRKLCRALYAAGSVAAQEGDTAGAVHSYLNCVRLGRVAARGGLITDLYVGAAIEGIGISGLSKVHHRLSAADCRELAQNLAALEAAREPLDSVLMRDTVWLQRALGWPGRLQTIFDDLTGESHRGQHGYETTDGRSRAFMRLLICDLGLRAFQLEQGKLPRDLKQLAPEYLAAVPEDPFSGVPLIYRVQKEGYMLYSIGPNRKDDGGRASEDDGDLLLGMYDKPAASP